jgi:hypothetical protein
LAAEGTKFRAMTSFRRAAVCLALVAMMLRGLMPAGWMPNPDGAGTSLFVICDMDQADMSKMDMSHMGMSGMDMSKMDMSAIGHDPAHKPSSDSHQHEACPFAAAPHVATPSTVVALLLPSLSEHFSPQLAGGLLAVQSPAYAPQSPRAPPFLV